MEVPPTNEPESQETGNSDSPSEDSSSLNSRPFPVDSDGSKVQDRRQVEEKKNGRRGKKRINPDKRQRELNRKKLVQQLNRMIGEGSLTPQEFAYSKVEEVYENGVFSKFRVTWQPTDEPPISFFDSIEGLKQSVERYQNMSKEEIISDLYEKQKLYDAANN
jgi:hypothetical protein